MRYEKNYYDCVVIYDNRGIIRENETREISFNNLKYNTFELIEDEADDKTNIEDIKKLYINDKTIGKDLIENWTGRNLDIVVGKKINELVQAVKQLNKEIKSIKEK